MDKFKCLSIGGWIRNMYYTMNITYQQKEQTTDTKNNMGEYHKYFAVTVWFKLYEVLEHAE